MLSDDRAVDFSGSNVKRVSEIAGNIAAGQTIHGITDGTLSLVDIIRLAAQEVPSDVLTLAVWTASADGLKRLSHIQDSGMLGEVRLLLDRSYPTREKAAHKIAVNRFAAIRYWHAHVKFAILTGGTHDVLILSSMNLNKNKRLENFTVHAGGELPSRYLKLVDDLYAMQAENETGKAVIQTRRLLRHGADDA